MICDQCGHVRPAKFMANETTCVVCEHKKRPSARAEPKQPKVSLADIAAAFERNREGL